MDRLPRGLVATLASRDRDGSELHLPSATGPPGDQTAMKVRLSDNDSRIGMGNAATAVTTSDSSRRFYALLELVPSIAASATG